MHARSILTSAMLLLALGCGDDVNVGAAGSTSGGSTGAPASTTGETDTADSTSTDATSSSGSSDATSSSGSSGETGDGETGDTEGDPPVCPPVPFTRVRGATVGGLTGWQVAGAGDFDGDGIGDFAISTPRADRGLETDSGRVHVIRGGRQYDDFAVTDIGDAVQGWVIEGESSNHRAGDLLRSIGDFDGDGRDDLMLSSYVPAPERMPEASGRWSVVSGVSAASVPVEILLSDVRTGQGGFAVDGRTPALFVDMVEGSGVGDVNGDGLDDVIFGAPFLVNFLGPSSVDVLFGRAESPGHLVLDAAGLSDGEGFGFYNPDAGVQGFIATAAGDVNGDGTPDVAFIAGQSDDNRLYVMFGGESVADVTIEDLSMGIGGFAIATATPEGSFFNNLERIEAIGDINGDGFGDLGFPVIHPLIDDEDRAGIGVVFGKADTDPVVLADVYDGVGGFVSTRPADDDVYSVGFRAGGAGDINGDGIDDIYVARAADPVDALGGDNVRGRLYVAYGQSDMTSLDLGTLDEPSRGFVFDSPEVNDDFAQSISAGQDVNGDGIPDFIVGAPQLGQFGSVYVVSGFNDRCPRVR